MGWHGGRVALSELISLALLCGIYKSLSQSIVFRYYPRAIYGPKSVNGAEPSRNSALTLVRSSLIVTELARLPFP
jgi:hypothetical protein